MTGSHGRLFAWAGWHQPALAFFAAGLLAGLAFAIAGPVAAVQALGGLAAVSAALGIVTVGYAATLEDPHRIDSLRAAVESLRIAIRARANAWADRMRDADRYLQNAVWSAMG